MMTRTSIHYPYAFFKYFSVILFVLSGRALLCTLYSIQSSAESIYCGHFLRFPIFMTSTEKADILLMEENAFL